MWHGAEFNQGPPALIYSSSCCTDERFAASSSSAGTTAWAARDHCWVTLMLLSDAASSGVPRSHEVMVIHHWQYLNGVTFIYSGCSAVKLRLAATRRPHPGDTDSPGEHKKKPLTHLIMNRLPARCFSGDWRHFGSRASWRKERWNMWWRQTGDGRTSAWKLHYVPAVGLAVARSKNNLGRMVFLANTLLIILEARPFFLVVGGRHVNGGSFPPVFHWIIKS